MRPDWATVVGSVLVQYTYENDEADHMIRRLKATGNFALAMGEWSEGDAVKAATVLADGLEDMGYKPKSKTL